MGISTGWSNHPAVKMWKGHEEVLAHYTLDICSEWVRRGYKDTCADKVREMFPKLTPAYLVLTPLWLDDIAESHQSNLIRKMPEHYGPLWPNVPNDLPYYWPV